MPNTVNAVDKDTRLCLSLSARPSNLGTRFHNFLYAELGLNYLYKATTTTDLPAAVAGLRALGIRGCGVSMPFKEDCLALVDVVHDSAAAIASVNTIVNDDGVLHAYNTDYQAVADLVGAAGFSTGWSVAVTGSGGMAKAVVAALRDAGFTDGTVIARNTTTGPALAEAYGYRWVADGAEVEADLLVNVTPVGMAGGPDESRSAFTDAQVAGARAVVDVVAVPSETPLIRAARSAGLPVVTGAEIIAGQAAEQFHLYTGVRPTADQVARASAYSRARLSRYFLSPGWLLTRIGSSSERGVTCETAAATRLALPGMTTSRPLSRPSTAARATSVADTHITAGSASSASALEKPAVAPKPVSTGPGHSVVAVTPVPLSSPARLWV